MLSPCKYISKLYIYIFVKTTIFLLYKMHVALVSCFTLNHIVHTKKSIVCGRVPWLYQYWQGGFMVLWFKCPGAPEGSTGSGPGFKASQKMGLWLKVSSNRLGEAGNQTCNPWFTRHRFKPYTTAAS